jgi:hypothetical protein
MNPCQQAQALKQEQLPADAVKSMAHGLPERDSVKRAVASAEKVSNPAHETDLEAIQAAKAWTQNPTPEAQKAAAAAAGKTDFQTPGAWAAQAAAWAGSGRGLTPHAITGAVLLAAAQGGKPISPPSVSSPATEVPKVAGLPKAPEVPAPKAPSFRLPFFKKPAVPAPEAPQVAAPGPDGLTLTPAQRTEMSKNCEPFLKQGCDIGKGLA